MPGLPKEWKGRCHTLGSYPEGFHIDIPAPCRGVGVQESTAWGGNLPELTEASWSAQRGTPGEDRPDLYYSKPVCNHVVLPEKARWPQSEEGEREQAHCCEQTLACLRAACESQTWLRCSLVHALHSLPSRFLGKQPQNDEKKKQSRLPLNSRPPQGSPLLHHLQTVGSYPHSSWCPARGGLTWGNANQRSPNQPTGLISLPRATFSILQACTTRE